MKVDVLIYPEILKKNAPVKLNRLKIKKLVSEALKLMDCTRVEVSILLTDDENIKKLNKKFRHMDKITDVLSFPMEDERILGDVAISLEKTLEQARRFKTTFEKELARLLTHGLAHLLGYDHVKGGSQAKKMRLIEQKVLSSLKSMKVSL